MSLNKFQAVLENVDQLDDCNEAKASVREVLPEGTAIVQLTTYVEVGIQDSGEYQGKQRPPSPKVFIGVHIIGGVGKDQNGVRKAYCANGEPIPLVSFYPIELSLGQKSKYYNTFKAFNYAGTARHFVELLGTIALLKISIVKKDDKFYNNYDLRTVTEPVKDVTEGTLHIAGKNGVLDTPEDDYKCFVWSMPDKTQWDSIEIAGTYEYTDAKGTTVTKSRNIYQDTIMQAHNFMDSPIEALLTGVSGLPSQAVKEHEGSDFGIDLDDDLPL